MKLSNGHCLGLAICVTFYYNAERLSCLSALFSNFPKLAQMVDVTIITNTANQDEQEAIENTARQHDLTIKIFVPHGLGHPYLLPWSHFHVMRAKIEDQRFTHFLYLEDDLLIRRETIEYLLSAREILRPHGLLPGVFRIERRARDGEWMATDVKEPVSIRNCSRTINAGGTGFVNLPTPYQGLYFLDRELMEEHLSGFSSNPDFGLRKLATGPHPCTWRIRERASMGLTFSGIPNGFGSRIVLPYKSNPLILASLSFVHHLQDKYANDPNTRFGKIRVPDVITE